MLADALRLDPLLVERPWGGRRLEGFGRVLPADVSIGESWEIADLPATATTEERCTVVAEGPLAGVSLSELITRFGAGLLGSAEPAPDGRFPLLVKLLDAREHLSVQVHPPHHVAAGDPGIRAKTESWYVLDAGEDAVLWFDVRTDVADTELAAAIGTPAIVDLLGRVPATIGAFHHIPAGRVHALGAGVIVLEIQTPSDTTFRIYDWTREYARPSRRLHPRDAVRSIERHDESAASLAASREPGVRQLVSSPDYWIREHRSDGGPIMLDDRAELRIVTVVAGSVALGDETLARGDSRLLPAASSLLGRLDASDGSILVETGLV